MFLAVSAGADPPEREVSSYQEGIAPAGWYPDPRGSGNLFYWDGSRWTGDVQGAPKPGSSGAGERLQPANKAVIGGGAALAISPFLPWVKVILLGNLSLFQLFDAAGRSSGLAWGAVLAGGAAAVIAFKGRDPSTVRATGLTVGLLGGVLALYALVGLRDELKDAHGFAAVAIGPYVSVAGCLAMVVGALMSKGESAVPT